MTSDSFEYLAQRWSETPRFCPPWVSPAILDCSSAEYSILKHYDGDYVAWVKAADDAKPKRFKVTGEAVPQYYAEEIEE